ncbi:UDP-N-acetylmuramate dehydrogenase [Gallaecimonas sp. GXIMD4217]|uniref:UDP-N-acetylmuramate dehydrogenase n=1 Tax=Gallaecimonas sp. GXIMD4217 TaxID=3131927 RepID=UPI00311AD9DD
MKVSQYSSLKDFNSFALDIQTRRLEIASSLADLLRACVDACMSSEATLVLGGGSNVLFTEDFDGTVLINGLKGIEVQETGKEYKLHVAAGESWPALVDWTVAQGFAGLENLALIPGSAGAAPIQNIGAYGVELAQRCDYVDFLSLEDRKVHRLMASDCRFGYRDSIFKGELAGKAIITAIGLTLSKDWQPEISYGPLQSAFAEGQAISASAIRDTVVAIRRAKLPDPALLGNAGSFFKNPTITTEEYEALQARYPNLPGYPLDNKRIKIPAGWLIDKAGWKGYRTGDAGVHAKQALVLVNHGHAKPGELLSLARAIKDDIFGKFAVDLVPEVRLIGASGEIPF